MKQKLASLLFFALTVLLTSCGNFESPPSEMSNSESSTQVIIEQSIDTDQFRANQDDTVAIDTDTNAEISANTDTDNNFVNSTLATSDKETISETDTSNHSQTTTDTVTQATDTDVSMNDDEWVEVECAHHDTSGDILVRTVTWSENESGRVWTCTQCGASAKDGESAKGTVRVKKSSLSKPSDSSPQDPLVCNHNRLVDGMWVDAYEYAGEDGGYDIYTCVRCCTTKRIKQEPEVQQGPYDVVAKEGTEELLAERILYYVNAYRKEEGKVTTEALPGLTKLAKMRSQQLIVNYGHNLEDIRAAATELQYGHYVDPTVWGWDVAPYYEPPGQEAIGEFSNLCTYSVDQMANRIANRVRNSQAHWSYVGAATDVYREYKYIGVGISFSNNSCYLCIFIANTNIYG